MIGRRAGAGWLALAGIVSAGWLAIAGSAAGSGQGGATVDPATAATVRGKVTLQGTPQKNAAIRMNAWATSRNFLGDFSASSGTKLGHEAIDFAHAMSAARSFLRFAFLLGTRILLLHFRSGFGLGLEVGFGLPDLREPRLTCREVREGLAHRVLVQLDRAEFIVTQTVHLSSGDGLSGAATRRGCRRAAFRERAGVAYREPAGGFAGRVRVGDVGVVGQVGSTSLDASVNPAILIRIARTRRR